MKYSHSTALAVALAMPLLASAQASAPTSGLRYQSAFADYKPYEDLPIGNWRALNDTLRDAGATAHGMAAAASASTSAPSKTAPRTPSKGPMDHGMPGGTK